jgi:hypothetical protein
MCRDHQIKIGGSGSADGTRSVPATLDNTTQNELLMKIDGKFTRTGFKPLRATAISLFNDPS